MSKPRKKNNKRKPVIPIAIGAVGLLLLIGALGFSNKGSEQFDEGTGTPVLTVDQTVIDFGDVKFNTEKTFSIRVTNSGDGTLRFKEEPYIQVMEGCWPPYLTIGSMVLKPGESTMIESNIFMMHEGMDGPHDFAVHLTTNAPGQEDLVVHVLSNWIP